MAKEKKKQTHPHLSSKVLMQEFLKLVTRPQYTQGERGADITEMTEIHNSTRLEETNPDRLKLAERVLHAALTTMEFEVNLSLHAEAADLQKKVDKLEEAAAAVKPAVGTGGYH
jgi:hypothetical protein